MATTPCPMQALMLLHRCGFEHPGRTAIRAGHAHRRP
jgi:hypothetical protein